MKRFIYLTVVFLFTPLHLECSTLKGVDEWHGKYSFKMSHRLGQGVTGFTTAFLWEDISGKYGDPVTVAEKTSIGDITKEPEKHLNKTVRVEGELFDVCQDMGCWFSIKDSTGAIYVDLSMGIKFTLPKKSNGYKAIVQGLVTNEGGKSAVKIKATGTEILGK